MLHQAKNKNSDDSTSEHALVGKGQSNQCQQEKRVNQLLSVVTQQVETPPTEGETKQIEKWNNTTMMSKTVGNCGNIALRTIANNVSQKW